MEYIGLDMRTRYRVIEPPIASGGEGRIYAIEGVPDKLAKVWHQPERVEQDKLRFMVQETYGIYGSLISRMIAWPVDALTGDSGQVVGFVMPRFPGVTKLSEILPDKGIDWGKRVVIAWNLCEIVQDVEKMNQCIGDMNPSNFGVDPESGHVYAFDADSFHFRAANSRLYPCFVGIAEYYAPELQRQITRGQDMRTLDPERTFSRQTDRFALAVLLFQLLFSGYHPFSARRLEHYGSSTVVHRQATNILNKVCAYFNPQEGTGIPIDAPPITIIPPAMQQLFRRAFLTEDRPSATEWQTALSDLSRNLRQCDRQHYYYSKLPACPWCAMPAPHFGVKQGASHSGAGSAAQGSATSGAAQGTKTSAAQGTKTAAGTAATQATKAAAAQTKPQEAQGGTGIALLISIAWVVLAYLMSKGAEAGSLMDRFQSGEKSMILYLVAPFIAALFARAKGFPNVLKGLGVFVLGLAAFINWFMAFWWLDANVLHWGLMNADSAVGVILTFLVMGFGIAVGFAGGKACARAGE